MAMWRGASRSWRPWLDSLCPDLCHGTDWQVVFLSVPCCLLCTFVVAFMAMNAFACSLCLFRSAAGLQPSPHARDPTQGDGISNGPCECKTYVVYTTVVN